MNVVSWARARVGRTLTAPGGLGGQCVDLVNLYVAARGVPLQRLNAVDWWHSAKLPGWRWVPNGPANYPRLGAVVVWNSNVTAVGTGPYGHIAVALAADALALLTLDQGWPADAPVSVIWHQYTGVLGWWEPTA
jgi:hypothetical protein